MKTLKAIAVYELYQVLDRGEKAVFATLFSDSEEDVKPLGKPENDLLLNVKKIKRKILKDHSKETDRKNQRRFASKNNKF